MTTTSKHNLQAGDILVSTWGYEQTNVEFFQVQRSTGSFVWIQKMASVVTDD